MTHLLVAAMMTLALTGCTRHATSSYARADDERSVVLSAYAIVQAPDAAAADAAYATGAAVNANDLRLNRAYVRRMVELGTPAAAYVQAKRVEWLTPEDGLALAVISYVQATNGEMANALANIVLAVRYQPDHPFVLRTAGQLAAWLNTDPAGVSIPEHVRQAMAEVAQALAGREEFSEAYAEAQAAYKELAAAEAIAATQPAEPEPYDDSGELVAGIAGTQESEQWEILVEGPTAVAVSEIVVNIYEETYVPPPVYDDWRWQPSLVIFLGRVRHGGMLMGRCRARDVIVDRARNLYVGRARDVHIGSARNVVIDQAQRVRVGSDRRLAAERTPHTLLADSKGTIVARRPVRRLAAKAPANTAANRLAPANRTPSRSSAAPAARNETRGTADTHRTLIPARRAVPAPAARPRPTPAPQPGRTTVVSNNATRNERRTEDRTAVRQPEARVIKPSAPAPARQVAPPRATVAPQPKVQIPRPPQPAAIPAVKRPAPAVPKPVQAPVRKLTPTVKKPSTPAPARQVAIPRPTVAPQPRVVKTTPPQPKVEIPKAAQPAATPTVKRPAPAAPKPAQTTVPKPQASVKKAPAPTPARQPAPTRTTAVPQPKVQKTTPPQAKVQTTQAPKPAPVVRKPTPAPKPAPVVRKPAPAPKPAPVVKKPAPAPKPAPIVRRPAPAPKPAPVVRKPAPAPKPPAPAAKPTSKTDPDSEKKRGK